MKNKTRVGVLFGGKSAEHEVSLQSAKNIIEAIDRQKFEVVLIGIDKTGKWFVYEEGYYLVNPSDPKLIHLAQSQKQVTLVSTGGKGVLVNLRNRSEVIELDVMFPVLHGPYGEDGSVQGLLKLGDVPFVGAGVLGSAVGMDKVVMKALLQQAAIPTPRFLSFRSHERSRISYSRIQNELGLPLFVKPANLGSSVGITKVTVEDDLPQALALAFQFDHKVLVEEFVKGREIECSVLGNEDPIASICGEIVPASRHGFYSYDAKYIDEKGAQLIVPAELSAQAQRKAQDTAVAAYEALCCEGMGRVDMFLTHSDEVLVMEINTIPGFTRVSMYPRLWQASGVSYSELITRLIDLALERQGADQNLRTSNWE